MDSFADCFDLADYVIITDIYPAGEPAIDGISGYSICEKLRVRGHPKSDFLPKDKIVDNITNILQRKDIILVLGAGDITKISDELARLFLRNSQFKSLSSKIC